MAPAVVAAGEEAKVEGGSSEAGQRAPARVRSRHRGTQSSFNVAAAAASAAQSVRPACLR